MISMIVAVAKNGAIGLNNALLWHITEDMKYFRATTTSHTVIMGRKSYDSIGFPLPNRRNIILSRDKELQIEGCEVACSVEEALELCKEDEKVFIIGGEQIYAAFFPFAQRLYVTEVEKEYQADAFFPTYNKNEFKELSRERFERGVKYSYPFSFVIYDKI